MRKDELSASLSHLAFDFFYWFSRFEFSLKENGYLKRMTQGAKAEPGWDAFVKKYEAVYAPSPEARLLLATPPDVQIVGANHALDWRPINLDDHQTELVSVARVVRTVRNNLFHGGKHGGATWDQPVRTEFLLVNAKLVLDQLATLGDFREDYERFY